MFRYPSVPRFTLLFALLLCPVVPTVAQSALDQAISAKFPTTIATADRTDIVTAGAVMTLKKSGIITFATTASTNAQLTYKDGKISASMQTNTAILSCHWPLPCDKMPKTVHRTFVQNEKLWLIDVKDANDGVVLQLLSDAIGDVRYTTFVKFPFARGSTPSADELIGQIGQVLSPDGEPAPTASAAVGIPPVAPPPSPAPVAPLPAIAPPPPPPDTPAAAPPTLEKGQVKDQVVAGFGQPTKVVKMGAKEIDYYKDMKVTYTNGKVTNIE